GGETPSHRSRHARSRRPRSQTWRRIIRCVLCFAFAVAGLRAQTMHDLHGTVVDETGAVLIAAAVTLDDGQGHHYTAQTDSRGTYQISNISPAIYTLTVTFPGFTQFTQTVNLTVRSAVAE